MTYTQAANIRKHDLVQCGDVRGRVTTVSQNAFRVLWENMQIGIFGFHDNLSAITWIGWLTNRIDPDCCENCTHCSEYCDNP
jgi:hypothetical protein